MFQTIQAEHIYVWFSLHFRTCDTKLYFYQSSLVRLLQFLSFWLQRLAQDPNYAVARAASSAIDELKKQWELEEGDSLRFVMNQNLASEDADGDNSAADDDTWGVNKLKDSNFDDNGPMHKKSSWPAHAVWLCGMRVGAVLPGAHVSASVGSNRTKHTSVFLQLTCRFRLFRKIPKTGRELGRSVRDRDWNGRGFITPVFSGIPYLDRNIPYLIRIY